MNILVNGRVQLVVAGDDGALVPVRTLEVGDLLGHTTLTREPTVTTAYALEEVTVMQINREYMEELVQRKPRLLEDIGRTIEERRTSVQRALAAAAD